MTPSIAKKRRRRRSQRGYSLLELLVVLAIMGLLIAIAGPVMIGYFEASKGKTAKIEISNVSTALDMYYLANGSYPTEQQGLKALIERPEGVATWDGPYLNRADGIVDPWDRPYLYKIPGAHGKYDISSLGADGKEGGTGDDADLGSW
ncbi:MAG: type II secretion system major pseudopilin GspG [Alphaproteobacteria bacterium]|nr:type II secretion system major pseudopilin GspG [Alphaproteobacteria bacterium]